jgi:hypothetical protein
MDNTQLTRVSDYDVNNIIFSKPVVNEDVNTDSAQGDKLLHSEPRPLPDDDIEPWLRASISSSGGITSEEIDRFICVARHNPNFDRADVNQVIRRFFVYQNADITPRDSVQRPLPDDDIAPWLHVSRSAGGITREEIERFMHVVRHNPNFNPDEAETVIYHLCKFHNFDAHLLPDDDVVPWLYASRYVNIPEPVMDRFIRVLRHKPDFHRNDVYTLKYNMVSDVHTVLRNVCRWRSGYSTDLQQLIEQACQESTQ